MKSSLKKAIFKRVRVIMLAVMTAAVLCICPVHAAEKETGSRWDPYYELGARFEISTDGHIKGSSIDGSMYALEISYPVITCTKLKARAYGTAYGSSGAAVGSYNSGDVVFDYKYYAHASATGNCPYTAPTYMQIYSRLEHVGYDTFNRGPYTVYP